MSTNQFARLKISYNNLTTLVFLGFVVGLPIFSFFQGASFYERYGIISILFALWAFLREPIVQIKSKKMYSLSNIYPDLAKFISQIPAFSALKNSPVLLYIPNGTTEVFTFGTWRKNYIAISEGAVRRWNDPDAITSVILHEVAHIANGDTWKTGFPMKYLYWSLSVTIFTFIMYFPYPLFFNISQNPSDYQASIADILIPLTAMTSYVMALFGTTRFLYRIKELAADEYAKKSTSMLNFVKAFIVPAQPEVHRERLVTKIPIQEKLSRFFRFHPNIQTRLGALKSSTYIIKEMSSLLFVTGLAVGLVTCLFSDINHSFAVMAVSESVVGLIALTIVFPLYSGIKTTDRVKLLVENIFSLANGIAVEFFVLIGITNLFITKSGGHVFLYLRQGVDLQNYLFINLDVFLIVLVIIPILTLIFFFILWILTKICIVDEKGWGQKSIIFSIVGLFPSMALCNFLLIQWWNGFQVSLTSFFFAMLLNILWVFVVALLWRMIPVPVKFFEKTPYEK